jgi:hypothetical protein
MIKKAAKIKEIVKKVNGNKKDIAYSMFLIAILLAVLKILEVTNAVSKAVGKIEANQSYINLELNRTNQVMDEKISYLDMNGCKPSTKNAKAIAVMRAK